MAKIDEINNKYGMLTVIGPSTRENKHTRWLCKCECGNNIIVYATNLRSNKSTNCGCVKQKKKYSKRFNILTGRFHKLTVLEYIGINKNRKMEFKCKCDCGKETVVNSYNLRNGHVKSCGCLQKNSIQKGKNYATVKDVLNTYKVGAFRRNLQWNIDFDLFSKTIKENCFYCNKEPFQKRRKNTDLCYNGIDRIDSNLGYEPGNIVACCKNCNWAKRSMTVKDFSEWVSNVYLNFVVGNKICQLMNLNVIVK